MPAEFFCRQMRIPLIKENFANDRKMKRKPVFSAYQKTGGKEKL